MTMLELTKLVNVLTNENEELKAKVEELKCCENCKYYTIDWCSNKDRGQYIKRNKTLVCNKWEKA